MQISDIGTAARNLADYIDLKGEDSDMQVVVAQVSLIVDRAKEVQFDRVPEMVK